MATRLEWARNAELPILRIWWLDEDRQLIDFSTGVVDWELKIGQLNNPALLTKTTDITGAAGSGDEHTGTPNVTVTWDQGDLDIQPGTYTLQLVANYVAGQRTLQAPVHIGAIVL